MAEQPEQPLTDYHAKAQYHAARIAEFYDAFIEAGFCEEDAMVLTLNVQRSMLDAEVYGA